MPRLVFASDLVQSDKSNQEKLPSLVVTGLGELCFRAPAARSAFEDMAVMEQAVEHRGDGSGVAEQLAPIFYGTFDVSSVLVRSYRRMTISRSSSAAVGGSLRIPRSSMISRGTV